MTGHKSSVPEITATGRRLYAEKCRNISKAGHGLQTKMWKGYRCTKFPQHACFLGLCKIL